MVHWTELGGRAFAGAQAFFTAPQDSMQNMYEGANLL